MLSGKRLWRQRYSAAVLGLLGAAILIVSWWGISLTLPPVRLPSPASVFTATLQQIHSTGAAAYVLLQKQNTGILANIVYTAANVAISVPIGAALGIVGGILIARVRWFGLLFGPITVSAAMMPMVVLAPVALIIFGPSRIASVALVILSTAIIMAFTSRNAAESLPPYYEAWALTLGARRASALRTIVLPASLPALVGGLRVALALAWGLEAFMEILGAPSGLGQVIEVESNVTNTPEVMAAVVWLALAAVLSDGLVLGFSKIRVRWQEVRDS